VLSEIKTLSKRGIAVILSTHDPDQAFVCAQRVAILHRGRLAYAGPPEDVITAAVLRAVYGVEVEIVEVESAVGDRHLICLPSFAKARSA
jgi:iron complex transport system ATP-binding protein